MLKIKRVGALDRETLDIELSNGSLILLNISDLLCEDSRYVGLRDTATFIMPSTDGSCVRWKNGTSLSLEDIFLFLKRSDKSELG